MPNTKRSWIIFLIGAGLTLIAAGLSPLVVAYAQETTPTPEPVETTPEPIYDVEQAPEVTGDNSYCLICHNQPWHTVTLDDGTIQNLYVDPDTIAASVHGTSSSSGILGCTDCHGADSFPHNNPSPSDERAYTLYAVSICASCHAQEAEDLEHGLHEEAIRAGNRDAAVCTDCHGAHDVRPIVEQPDLIAGVCGRCHETTLVEWRSSAHVNIEPLGCATCHSPHSQRLRAGNTPDELCTNCHKDVADTFIHNEHLTDESNVTCLDCHMYRGELSDTEAVSVSTLPMSTGHTMLMDTTPCTTCHEELVTTGEWSQIVASRGEVEIPPETVETPVEAEIAAADELEGEISYVQLLQGLMLGLGFGVTFAAVFITRGNRVRTPESEESATQADAPPEDVQAPPDDTTSTQSDDNPEA